MTVRAAEGSFRCEPTSPREARAVAGRALESWGLHALVDDVEVVVTELVTNAVLHAGTAVGLLVSYDERGLLLEVRDNRPEPFELPVQDPFDADTAFDAPSTTGRGLVIVDALTDTWGVDVDANGKTVWVAMAGDPDRAPIPPADAVVPDAVDEQGGAVLLLDVPTWIVVANVANFDDRARELTLVAGAASVAPRLAELAAAFAWSARSTAAARLRGRRAAREAAARGDATFTVSIGADHEALAALRQLTSALGELDAFAARGELLVPPAPEAVVTFRQWCLDEADRQLGGAAPSPFPV